MGPATQRALKVDDPKVLNRLIHTFWGTKGPMILQIALDTPLRRVFDYRPPAHFEAPGAPPLGVRVRVPFGRRQLIGILVGVACESAVVAPKLKEALAILDEQPIK